MLRSTCICSTRTVTVALKRRVIQTSSPSSPSSTKTTTKNKNAALFLLRPFLTSSYQHATTSASSSSTAAATSYPYYHHYYPTTTTKVRYMSTNNNHSDSSSNNTFNSHNDSSSSSDTTSSSSVDETLDKLFQASQQQIAEASAKNTGDAWFSTTTTSTASTTTDQVAAAASTAVVDWEPVWYNLADQAVVAVQAFHNTTGLEYGWSIVGVTVLLRLALFPIMVQTQKSQSRMAHLQPELQHIQRRYEALGTPSRQDQIQFSKQMQALFAKYQVKPLRAFAAPLLQLPAFMGMFFGLRKMPHIFTEPMSTGGMYWFVDLTVPDPLYILPVVSTASFLLLTELGKDQMMASNPAQGQIMVNLFRALSLVMLPVCVSFESSMLVYWSTNNLLTILQTTILKSSAAKKAFGIWDAPKPVPGTTTRPDSLTDTITKLANKLAGKDKSEKQQMQQHNQVVDARKKAAELFQQQQQQQQGTTRTTTNNPCRPGQQQRRRRRLKRTGITGTRNY